MPRKLEPDYKILIYTVALIIIGMVMIYSSSGTLAGHRYGDPAHFLKRQIIWAVLGGMGMAAAMRFDYHRLARYAAWVYIAAILLLFLVLVPAFSREVGGARRWLVVGGFTFQPAEFAKLALIIFFSAFLVKKESVGKLKDFITGYMPNAFALGICFVLILLQPDMGTSLILAVVVFTLFFISGIRTSYIAGTLLMLLPFIYAAIVMVDYRKKRLLSFLNPWADPFNSGFQIIQSYVAFGNGHIAGLGLGGSMQKNYFLPDAHTDFIFSIIGEEIGFIGCTIVVALFAALVYRGFKVAYRAPEPFGMYLATGITINIGLQAVVNIGVATGMLPTKGLPLPFISLGGSALVIWMISIGMLLNVSEHTN
ncbi:MAG: putative lipid II flippase FtsW [bacterium]|nr:MAG: putative lipid II flippase FtsW [bacterium]